MTIEDYFEQPCWVIDPLPRQVPADSRGKYFAVEQYLLRGPHREALAHRVVRFLLKLYCYQPLRLFWPDTEQTLEAPSPEELADRVFTCLTGRRPAALLVLLPEAEALLTMDEDDLNLTLYHPSAELLELIRPLAMSEGLFLWQPREAR